MAHQKSKTEITNARRKAGSAGSLSRWGERRPPSRTIRINEDAYAALQRIPERDRRAVASAAILDVCD